MKQLAFILAILATPAQSDVKSNTGKVIECYCTDSSGGRVELGEEICLFVDGRSFMALCDMSLNNPTWRDTGRECLSSQRRVLQSNQILDLSGDQS